MSKVYLCIWLLFLVQGTAKILFIEAMCLFLLYNFILVELCSKLIDNKLLA